MERKGMVRVLEVVGGVGEMLLGTIFLSSGGDNFERNQVLAGLLISGAALATAGAAWLHWRRFMVPITVAAGSASMPGPVLALVVPAVGPQKIGEQVINHVGFAAGLARVGFPTRLENSDREHA